MNRLAGLFATCLLSLACASGGAKAEAIGAADVPPAEPPPPAAEVTPAVAPEAPVDAEEAWVGESEAKAERVPPGAEGKTETRTMEVIAQTVKDNRKAVRDCFDKAKKELPDLKGDMVIHFVVDPEGKVRRAELNQERSTLKSPAVVSCSIEAIKAIKFPPSSRGMDTTVNYPFNLN
jgi:hypothetical protein